MSRKFDSVKALKTLIKLAAVALTSPATVTVASSLYPEHRITQVVVSGAALVLIEGCLLLGWQMLDQYGKSATLTQRGLYASLAWVAYFALFGIALYHQEGLAGLAFRLTLGVMLVYASAEAGLLADLKRQQQADKDIYTDRVVKRYARRLSRQDAKAELDSAARLQQLKREARERVSSLRVQRQTEQAVKAVKAAESGKAVEPPKNAKLDGRSTNSLDRANKKRKLSKQQAVERTFQLLAEQPGIGVTDIARQIGRSRQRVYDYLNEMERAGRLHGNGQRRPR
jgi:hypothetical protein